MSHKDKYWLNKKIIENLDKNIVHILVRIKNLDFTMKDRNKFMKQENLIDNFEKIEANLGQFEEIGSLERL